jgi:hypothetical protein
LTRALVGLAPLRFRRRARLSFSEGTMSERKNLELPFQRHSLPSIEAAESMAEKVSNLQAVVLAFIKQYGPCTDESIALGLSLNPSTARPRRIELQKKRLIVEAGEGMTRSGRKAALWKVASSVREMKAR